MSPPREWVSLLPSAPPVSYYPKGALTPRANLTQVVAPMAPQFPSVAPPPAAPPPKPPAKLPFARASPTPPRPQPAPPRTPPQMYSEHSYSMRDAPCKQSLALQTSVV